MRIEDDAGHELGLWPPTAVATYHRLVAELEGSKEIIKLQSENISQLYKEKDHIGIRAETAEQQVAALVAVLRAERDNLQWCIDEGCTKDHLTMAIEDIDEILFALPTYAKKIA